MIALIDGIVKTLPEVLKAILQLMLTLIKFISARLSDIVQLGINTIMALVKGIFKVVGNYFK